MINVQVAKEVESGKGYTTNHILKMKQAARQALQYADPGLEADVTLALTDDSHIQELNQQYLGIEAPTDVLAFQGGEVDPDSQAVYLGDIIISYPRALAQSASAGHAVQDELQLLTVHGILHLLGYDHAEPKDRAVMWKAQAEILAQVGCSAVLPSA